MLEDVTLKTSVLIQPIVSNTKLDKVLNFQTYQ